MQTKQIERAILERPMPAFLPPNEGWVLPHYDGLSIANIPPTIAALLGADLPGSLPTLPPALWSEWVPGLRRVVLIIMDAMGYRLLQGMLDAGEGQVFSDLAQAGSLIPLTSVFPSTTDAALVSLRTGLPPAAHAYLAYVMYMREFGMATNAILLSPVWTRQHDLLVEWGLDPDTLVSARSLAAHLGDRKVSTVSVLANHFRRSGFTQMLYQGVDHIFGHHLGSDLWVQLRHALASTRGKRAYITAYWSGLDSLGHAYGPDSEEWEAEFRAVSHGLKREFLTGLPAADREGTLLLITADHGQIRIPPEQIALATQDAELMRHLLVPIMGESRAAFVYPRPGRYEAIRDHLTSAYPGWFAIADTIEALEAGLMGKPICDETFARAGELLVLPRGTHALQRDRIPIALTGRHGGLTPEEMLVPLIAARLESL